MDMTKTLLLFERRARYVMVAASVLVALLAVAFKAGWITEHQSYDRHAWYLISAHDRFVVTSEYQDEAACHRAQDASSTCRSGGSLIEEATRQALHGARNG
jgi:hypothetical protein